METLRRDLLKLAGGSLAAATVVAAPALYAADRFSPPQSDPGLYDVRAYGAIGDGTTIDTPAVNRAIQAAANAGGGTVLFPAGTYACYSIHLQSRVTLHLAPGATILAAPTPTGGAGGYDAPESNAPWEHFQDYGHNHWHNSLLWGENLHDVSITGPGLIWGRGLDRGWGRATPNRVETPGGANKSIALKNCHNVTLKDFSILQGGWFAILVTGVDNLIIDSLTIDTNRDGMDIDCCRNVRVSNCTVNSPWDDAIVPKSSFALGYARATENVTISNCYVTGTYQMGTLLDGSFKKFPAGQDIPRIGRIKFGTESNGGFKNIAVSNCVFEGCRGLALETVDGALLEDVSITNITMRDIVTAPIFLRLGARLRGPQGIAPGQLRRVLLSNIVASGVTAEQCSIVAGLPGHPVRDIQMHSIYIEHQGTTARPPAHLPEAAQEYPEPDMFGTTPAQGFYLRHAQNIDMSHIEIAALSADPRPAFVLDDVQGADFLRIKAPKQPGTPTFSLHNVQDFSSTLSRGVLDQRLEHVIDQTL